MNQNDSSEPKIIKSFTLKNSDVLCCSVSDYYGGFSAGLSTGNIFIYPSDSINNVRKLTGHKNSVTCIKSSDKSPYLVSGSMDGTIRLWGEESACIPLGDNPLKSISITSSFDKILALTESNSMTLWDPHNLAKIVDLRIDKDDIVNSCAISDNRLVVTCSQGGNFVLHDLRSGASHRLFRMDMPLTSCSITKSGSYACCGCENGRVLIQDPRNEAFINKSIIHKGAISFTDFHPSENYLLSSAKDGSVSLFDIMLRKKVLTLTYHEGPVLCSQFSASGHTFATCGADKRTVLLDFKQMEADSFGQNRSTSISEMDECIYAIHSLTDNIELLSKKINTLETVLDDVDLQIKYLEKEKRKQAKCALNE